MKTWKTLAEGSFTRADLSLEFRDVMGELSFELESSVSSHWEASLLRASQNGQRLFDGGLFHVECAKAKDGRLNFKLSRTSYRRWTYAAGREGGASISRPMACCAAIVSADGKILLQERSAEVAEGAGLLHVPGGHPDPGRDMRDDLPDLFGAMEAEIEEELALKPSDLDEGRILALIENVENGKPELLFRYECTLSSEQIASRSILGRDIYEYDCLWFIPSDPVKLEAFLAENEKRLAVPSQALLKLLSKI